MNYRKLLMISQSRSGSTKMFFYLCEKLGISDHIKEVQQEKPETFALGQWKNCDALGLLTDAVFYKSRLKMLRINSVIQHCEENEYFILGLFRKNKLKQYISEKFAYHMNNFSLSNKDNIEPWFLDTDNINEIISNNEKHENWVKDYVQKNAYFDFMLSFEDAFENDVESELWVNDKRIVINFYDNSYIEKQAKMYEQIVNFNEIPNDLLKKYPLFS
jgi:hypothetical protein